MRPGGFLLAATTSELRREPEVREVADLVEFRMDKATDPIAQLESYDGNLPIVATNRPRWEGGEAPDAGRLDRLVEAAGFEAVELVDVELETVRGEDSPVSALRENGVEVICSHHDFEETPSTERLTELIEACSRFGDVAKVATFAVDRGDALRLLSSLYETTEQGHRVAALAMGADGSLSRVLAPFYGSALGYAPLQSDDEEYAPGQLPIHTLASLVGSLEESCG